MESTLTSMVLQYGVPLEQLVNKFAYQRFEPSGYVFRWLGCEFIKGYKEATSPDSHQPDLAMPEIVEMENQVINRPVPELSLSEDSRLPKVDRVKAALGTAYMGVICSNCGSDKVIRAGACGVCTQCGTSQGCS